jgi:hypothetical protein
MKTESIKYSSLKLNKNQKRVNYLKTLSSFSLCIDIFSYTTFEFIELIFSEIKKENIICFISKVNTNEIDNFIFYCNKFVILFNY